MSVLLFQSAAPTVTAPTPPKGWLACQWQNWGQKKEPAWDSMPQGAGTAPTIMHDFEPEPGEKDAWSVYDRGEDFARMAATAVCRKPGYRHLIYGPAAITGAQADAGKKAGEDRQLDKLAAAFFTLGTLGCTLAMDISLRAGQTVETWKYALPMRFNRLSEIGFNSRMRLALVLGVRRGGGGLYANTVAHTDGELREMAAQARHGVGGYLPSSTLICVWAHYPSAEFSADGARAYGVLADALAPSGLKPRAGVPTVGPGADARGGM